MSEKLIDSENVIAWLNAQIEKAQGGWLHDYGFPTNVIAALTDVKRFVKNLPTVKAEPVRRGRMIEGRYPNENKCSECGKMFRDDIGFIIQDDYGVFHNPARCPECGCYWDGGAEDAEQKIR